MAGPARRWPRRLLVVAVLLVPVAWLGWSAWNVWQGVEQVRAAEVRLRVLADRSPGDLLQPATENELIAARDELAEADDRFASPLLAPLRHAPVLGRNLRAGTAMTATARRLADAAVPAWRELRALSAGPEDLFAVGSLAGRGRAALAPLVDAVGRVDLGPADDLAEPVAEVRDKLDERLGDLTTAVTTVDRLLAAVEQMTARPGRYLIVAGNNAEMASGMGTFLSWGSLETGDGSIRVGAFTHVAGPSPVGIELPAELAERWGRVADGKDLRNLSVSARFDLVAEAAAGLAEAQTGSRFDGVLYLDPVFLREMVRLTGPVEVLGRRIDADRVLPLVLNEQYTDPVLKDRQQRALGLDLLAQSVIQRLLTERLDPVDLFEALRRSADGRHLMVWGRDAVEQAGWEAAGVSGTLGPRSLAVSVQNRRGSKLDWYVEVAATMRTTEVATGVEARVELTVRNDAPTGLDWYVGGLPRADAGLAIGDYLSLVSFHLPQGTSSVRIDGYDGLVAEGPDGATQVAAVNLVVPRGQTRTITATFVIPRRGPVRVESSARAKPVRWDVDGVRFDDGRYRTVTVPAA
jgi:hypothetical protein